MGESSPPPNRELTSITEAIKVFPVTGNSSIFTAKIAWDWCGAWSVIPPSLLDYPASFPNIPQGSTRRSPPLPHPLHRQILQPPHHPPQSAPACPKFTHPIPQPRPPIHYCASHSPPSKIRLTSINPPNRTPDIHPNSNILSP